MRLAGSGPFVDGLQTHLSHQSADAMTPHDDPSRRRYTAIWRDPKNGYLVNTRLISFIIASVSTSIPAGA
jgi:hypothetical protein